MTKSPRKNFGGREDLTRKLHVYVLHIHAYYSVYHSDSRHIYVHVTLLILDNIYIALFILDIYRYL